MRAPESAREAAWKATMSGTILEAGPVLAHGDGARVVVGDNLPLRAMDRQARENAEASLLVAGATLSSGAGARARPEDPDPLRTCFERDRDRVLHSSAFRRLAGKTQVFVFPKDHQRTRLTHALEVAQVATAVARATGLNVALTEAIALGHDCGHGPGGHASEEAFAPYLEGGYNHAIWGAEVVLAPLNLCQETVDGIRNHSWSLPSPRTPEGAVVSWADRCAYCAHDLEDAASAGIVDVSQLPDDVSGVVGRRRSEQLRAFVGELVDCIVTTGHIGMRQPFAGALAALRAFNYEHIYTRPSSVAQGDAVIAVLRALVDYYCESPSRLPPGAAEAPLALPAERLPAPERVCRAITYVGGMTDAYAFDTAVRLLGWDPAKLPVRQH
ncbi:MAG TPA: HD domain-containing protein [Acidimicrobiales bacterium]|nr:HD domain-containing protein [Acidimicrobiales bacterium]